MELIVYNPAQPYAKRRPAPQLHAIVLSTPLFLVPPLERGHLLLLLPLVVVDLLAQAIDLPKGGAEQTERPPEAANAPRSGPPQDDVEPLFILSTGACVAGDPLLLHVQGRDAGDELRERALSEVAEVAAVAHALALAVFEGGVDHTAVPERGSHLRQQGRQLGAGHVQDR